MVVEFVELPHPDAHLHTAVQLYGSDIRVRKPCERPDRCGARARGV